MKALLLILVLAVPLHAQNIWIPNFSTGDIATYSAALFDFASTKAAERKGYVESNPLVGRSTAQQLGVLMGTTYAVNVIANHLERGGRTGLAWFVRSVHIGTHATAGVYNYRSYDLRPVRDEIRRANEQLQAVTPLGGPPLSLPGGN